MKLRGFDVGESSVNRGPLRTAEPFDIPRVKERRAPCARPEGMEEEAKREHGLG